jgi:hypothetical protein
VLSTICRIASDRVSALLVAQKAGMGKSGVGANQASVLKRSAKALGLAIPKTLLAPAYEVKFV